MKKSKLLIELMETKEELRALTEDFSAQIDMYEEADSKVEGFKKENERLQGQLHEKDLKLKRWSGFE